MKVIEFQGMGFNPRTYIRYDIGSAYIRAYKDVSIHVPI